MFVARLNFFSLMLFALVFCNWMRLNPLRPSWAYVIATALSMVGIAAVLMAKQTRRPEAVATLLLGARISGGRRRDPRVRLGLPLEARVVLSLAKFNEREAPWDLLRTSAREEYQRHIGSVPLKGRARLLGNADKRVLWAKSLCHHLLLFLRPGLYFAYRYFLRLGVLDGLNGFIFHFLQAFWFQFVLDLRLAELLGGSAQAAGQ
jgi:hypothetical protein